MAGGALGNKTGLKETVKIAVPLLGARLAIAPAFKMKFWNIGAEGQILAGGIAATYFALFWADKLPRSPCCSSCSWPLRLRGPSGGLSPVFKAKWGTNETLFTLMLNYIALGIQAVSSERPLEGHQGHRLSHHRPICQGARLPKVFGVHAGWIIVLIFVVLMFLYLRYTKQGYEISVVGESEPTARYCGHERVQNYYTHHGHLRRDCGRGGLYDGLRRGLHPQRQHRRRRGFTAITVAWLAKLNPIVMVFIAAFLAVLTKGLGYHSDEFRHSQVHGRHSSPVLFCSLCWAANSSSTTV